MDAKGQFSCFCLCIAVGFVGGVLYSACSFLRVLFSCQRGKNKVIGAVIDVLFFTAFALFCTACAFVLKFPAFRPYIWAGQAIGLILYLKSLHKVVAFFQNICYNKVAKAVKKLLQRKKTQKRLRENDARKNEKTHHSVRDGRHGVARLFAQRFGVSMDNDRRKCPSGKEN